jgi:ribosomal protein S18 acetylase RimI-like enzyme
MAPESDITFKPVVVTLRDGRRILVREYGMDDFAALVEMYKGFEPKRVAQGLPPPDTPRIANWLDRLQQKSRSLMALYGDRVSGQVILCPISDASVEYTIFVHQDYRCQGLGTQLTHWALSFAREMGFAEVFLCTELTNYPALSLYRRMGFQTTSIYGEECEMKLSLVSADQSLPRAA